MKLLSSVLCFIFVCTAVQVVNFWDNYYVTFGETNVKYPGNNGNIVQLGLTNITVMTMMILVQEDFPRNGLENVSQDVLMPGSGFRSKVPYLFGQFSMKIKLVGGNSAGTVTSYYMASTFTKWCELDFEFLGNLTGQPYILQTNVFSEGIGNREQRINLWFDPSADYHDYGVLWNQALILFLVDGRVIRVFHKATDLGIPYLDYQPMYIYTSIWNGESWATQGGRVKTNWTAQPFIASYTGFDGTYACGVKDTSSTEDLHACYKMLYQSSYGQAPNLALSAPQIDHLKLIHGKYLIYDYCSDLPRFGGKQPPECRRNWPSISIIMQNHNNSEFLSHGLSIFDRSPHLSRDKLTV